MEEWKICFWLLYDFRIFQFRIKVYSLKTVQYQALTGLDGV